SEDVENHPIPPSPRALTPTFSTPFRPPAPHSPFHNGPARLSSDGEGFLLVYSITSRATFERIEQFREQILRVKDVDSIPLIVVGNKCDKVAEREVAREEGLALAKKMRCEFIESSAKSCVNVDKAFYTVVRQIRESKDEGGAGALRRNKDWRKCEVL
ncbi:MAG: ras family-domain-containing protein, partial [Olpidium bornovanus]